MKPLDMVADRSKPKLNPSELKIVAYLYDLAAGTPDRRVSKSIREIAEATGLSQRTVQDKLHALDRADPQVIRILSKGTEKTLLEIPPEHGSLPSAARPANSKPALPPPPPASIEALILRLTRQRPSAQNLAYMKAAAGNDDQRLQDCLNTFLLKGKTWETVDLLTVAVQHHLRQRDYFDYGD